MNEPKSELAISEMIIECDKRDTTTSKANANPLTANLQNQNETSALLLLATDETSTTNTDVSDPHWDGYTVHRVYYLIVIVDANTN
jgi:hypothetical protein